MLMAQALIRHKLGADWRAPRDSDDLRRCQAYCELLRLFADHPGPRCLYSIHNMVQVRGGRAVVGGGGGGPYNQSRTRTNAFFPVLAQSNKPTTMHDQTTTYHM